MPHDINIYPTPAEQRLLAKKAAEYGMSIDEFVAYVLRQALTETSTNIRHIIKH